MDIITLSGVGRAAGGEADILWAGDSPRQGEECLRNRGGELRLYRSCLQREK